MSVAAKILVLGTADWDQAIATNQHYVVREMCVHGTWDVTFVESMALRRPQLSRRDLRRIWRRIRRPRGGQATASSWRPRPAGLEVITPMVIPWHRGPARLLNRYLLKRLVRRWAEYQGPKILWTYTPVTYGLQGVADVTVYHCVDLLAEVPGIDPVIIERGERALADGRATAIGTSVVVANHLRARGFGEPLLWENVADTQVTTSARHLNLPRRSNYVIFAGNLAPSKIDYELLRALAEAGVGVHLAGPRAEGGGNDDEQFQALLDSGVEYLGLLSITELARELTTAAVGIIPYVLNNYTQGVSPLKTFEYLSAGLPVVSTNLPGVSPVAGDVFVETSREAFVTRVKSLAGGPSNEEIVRRAQLADGRSWSGRGLVIREMLRRLTGDDS